MSSSQVSPDAPDLKTFLAATTNRGKVLELRDVLRQEGLRVLSPDDVALRMEVEETGATFEQNAALKAAAYCRAAGMSVIADDSGLEVVALGGAPGVLSARYGGPGRSDAERVALLLANLRHAADRSARFVCCLALQEPGEEARLFRGEVAGTIASDPRGTRGFGYDPVFIPSGQTCTFAEMTLTQKDEMSHRARALRELCRYLRFPSGQYTEP